MKKFDKGNLFKNEFTVDPNLIKKLGILKDVLESKYRAELSEVIVQGARTEESNKEYYQNKYGEDWKRHFNKNSLHIVRKETGNMLRAVDVGYEKPNGVRLSGDEIYRAIQENYIFGNVGVSDTYVHVDTLIRVWRYRTQNFNV